MAGGLGELDHLGVNLPEFLAFSPKVPNLLFPAFHVQVRHQGGKGGGVCCLSDSRACRTASQPSASLTQQRHSD